MSMYVIARNGEYYAGFEEGEPVWLPKRRTPFDGDVAAKILLQLAELGFSGVELKPYTETRRSRRRATPSAPDDFRLTE